MTSNEELEHLRRELRRVTKERDWWSRVARAYARKHVLAKVSMRILGQGISTRQRNADELRRMVDALMPDDVSDVQ